MKLFEEKYIANKEKVQYEKRIRFYRVQSEEQWAEALTETRQMGRIPVFIRTQQCHVAKDEALDKVREVLGLPEKMNEIDLRKMFLESQGNPLKKNEQKQHLNQLVKTSILEG